ncbi:helix-turn-helix domain-containing protein [Synechocystis salina]|uniref:Helix-turn-helix transcriptional regulator n=1 Tax=Synechocystis salina LEGE 00031 TaxID=1828736 RepID=A0ABR9VNK8_9SYNC|nr:helix-turn-helix domain-containing protein [Synechocystis salina]MBE9242112.1 helix-turn-helix transcriptional regulator [Synechocystis salina LEGE 00041]MBE9252915.1 helix-turn-helix transcriptional regulator [Synechocystis salina LEGE 00031]
MVQKVQPPTPNLIHQKFQDTDEMAEALRLPLRITPLVLAPYSCEAVQLNLGNIAFNFTKSVVPLRVVGPKPAEAVFFSFLLNAVDEQKFIAHNCPINRQMLFGFDSEREVDLVIADSVLYCYVAVSAVLLNQYLCLMERDDLDARFLGQNQVCIPTTIGPLQVFVRELYTLVVNQTACLASLTFQRLLKEDFIPLLIQSIPPKGQLPTTSQRPLRRGDLVRQTEAFLEAHLNQPITLAAVAKSIFTSQRTLTYAFDQILGISPMVYLKILRLQVVRRLLKMTVPGTRTISAIAAEHGFYSPGHFARDYKTLFGETPKETLKQ